MSAQTASWMSRQPTRADRWVVIVCVALVATGVAYAIDPGTFKDAAGIVAALGNLTAGWLLSRYGRRTDSEDGLAFRLLGAGAIVGGTGMILFGVVSSITELPVFGPLDVVFFTMYGLLLASLAYMPSVQRTWRAQIRLLIDGLVGAVSVGALVWTAVGDQIFQMLGDLPLNQRFIGLAYPLLDMSIIVGVMVVVVKRGQYQFDIRLLLLVIGFTFQVAADLSYLSSTSSAELFAQAEPNFLLFLSSALAFVLAGAVAGRVPPPVEIADRKSPLWAYAAPYGIGALMSIVTIWRDIGADAHRSVLSVATFTLLFLVIARQWLAIQENRSIVEKERRSLIASVSHELRTPLTSMIGFLTILEDPDSGITEGERAELGGVVLDQANYMGRMVTDIILLARDQPEMLKLTEQPVRVEAFVDGVLDTLGGSVPNLAVDAIDEATFLIDSDRVKQIATNLINNAFRYGGGQALLVVGALGSDLVIEVHDNGDGVPKKYEHTIWERFERGPHKLDSAKPGTGLGLAIVDMIARAHQGTVGYRRSERLGGACFFARLPGRLVSAESGFDDPISPSWPPVSARSL